MVFENCRFLGYQDTLYAHGRESRQYYKDCYIEGTTDFIFGWSTAVFEDCEIFSRKGGHYITAASTEKDAEHGFVFINCSLTGDAPEEEAVDRLAPPVPQRLVDVVDLGPPQELVAVGLQGTLRQDRAMAVVVLGGLIASILMNLFVVPALYLRVASPPPEARADGREQYATS